MVKSPHLVLKSLLFFFLLLVGFTVYAQKIPVQQLIEMLNWQGKRIDTTLKKQGYLLMQKDVDSGSLLFQYSFLDAKEDEPTTIQSLIYMDVETGKFKSRLITYRTYSNEEFRNISSWLLANNYHATGQYDFDDSKHTVYSNGQQTIRIKVITTKLKNSKTYIAYELELGK